MPTEGCCLPERGDCVVDSASPACYQVTALPLEPMVHLAQILCAPRVDRLNASVRRTRRRARRIPPTQASGFRMNACRRTSVWWLPVSVSRPEQPMSRPLQWASSASTAARLRSAPSVHSLDQAPGHPATHGPALAREVQQTCTVTVHQFPLQRGSMMLKGAQGGQYRSAPGGGSGPTARRPAS